MAGNPRRSRHGAAVAAILALASCRAPGSDRPSDTRYEPVRAEIRGTEARPSREWVQFSVGFLDREQADGDPVGDGLAWIVDGGFEIARTALTPSVEFGMAYASAHVSLPDTPDVDLWRGTAGMRATWYGDGWRPYVRGGWFLRWSTDDLDEPLDPYATGFYAGLGADWPYPTGMWLGPSLLWYHSVGEDAPGGDADELLFALSATFRL